MLDKIKAAIRVGEDLDKVKDKLNMQSQCVDELTIKVTEMQSLVEDFTDQQKQIFSEQKRLIDQFQKDRLSLAEQIDDLKQELYNFKMLKGQMQHTIMEKFEHELQSELIKHKDSLKLDAGNYQQVKSQINESVSHLAALNMQITELRKLVSQVKEKDFEFSKMLGKVAQYEREKQELLDRLDKAERLAARMIRK